MAADLAVATRRRDVAGGSSGPASVGETAADGPGHLHQHPSMPAVDPPEAVQPYEYLSSGGEQVFRFWENVERRPVRLAGEPYDASVIRAWTRFRPVACFEDPFLDASRALILLDTYGFPAAYQRYRSWEYLALNLDTMGVSGRVWDVHGALLASGAAQLCCIPNHNGEA